MRHFIFIGLISTLMFMNINIQANERSVWDEDYYNRLWCERVGGEPEFVLPDRKRVDCLIDSIAVEADWASGTKPYEAIGQALYYAKETNRKPGILLLIKDRKGHKWVRLVKETMKFYGFNPNHVWYIIAHERIKEIKNK